MSDTTEILKKLMDGCSARHAVLANNIANANTPGFRRKDVSFKDSLSKAMTSGKPNAIASVQLDTGTDNNAVARPDGNSVSIQKELGMLTENGLLYALGTKALSMKFAGIRKAIRGR